MDNIAIQKAGNLEAAAKDCLDRLFGRSLQEGEEVTILVLPQHAAPCPAERQIALQRASRVLDKAAEQMVDVSEREFDEAVEEAIMHVRKRKS